MTLDIYHIYGKIGVVKHKVNTVVRSWASTNAHSLTKKAGIRSYSVRTCCSLKKPLLKDAASDSTDAFVDEK